MPSAVVFQQAVKPIVGILGGTFDPVHVGHLRLAVEVLEEFDLGELRLIPNALPNLRAGPVADDAQRLAMLHAASAGIEGLIVDDREIRRGGISYSIDTLRELRTEHPESCLLFILGMDAFLGLPRWHRWREILDAVSLLVVTRPDAALPDAGEFSDWLGTVRATDVDAFCQARNGRVLIHPVPLLPVSSTGIRARVAAGRRIDFLVPDAVRAIIEREGLYRP